MIQVTLSPEAREELRALRRDTSLSPAERDRVEMLLLSAEQGFSPPKIARHLGCHPKTVRLLLKAFREQGVACVRHRRPGPAPDLARRQQITFLLDQLLAQDRTWTAGQLAEALTQAGFPLGTRHTTRYLHAMGAKWKRTVRTLSHKQDPQKVERACTHLQTLKKRPLSGGLP